MSDKNKIRYTTMCMWVDENAYSENCDEIKLYEYIQGIITTQAMKRKLFRTRDDYEEFSIYFASELFMRYRNPKQYESDSDGEKLEKIKSISNYVIQTVYFNYIIFLRKYRNFPSQETPEGLAQFNPQFRDSLVDTTNQLRKYDFEHSVKRCYEITRDVMNQTAYRKDSVEWHNIYMSCMLTLLNCFTLSGEQLKTASTFKDSGKINQRAINKQFNRNRHSKVKLYRLPDSMAGYIYVLSRKMMKEIASQLSDIVGGYIIPDDIVDAVVYDEMPDISGEYV